MVATNKGFEPEVIKEYQEKMKASKRNFVIVDSDDNSDEYVNFYFVGMYEGKEVIYDAVIYTLRLHYNSELYEIAEHKAAKNFPEFESIRYKEDENGDLEILDDKEEEIGLYMAEVITELEEDGEVKVKEHVELDENIDFGVGLDVGLNVDEITKEVISKFVKDYNEDNLKLDDTYYTFQTQDEELMD
ncbi:hypothetical protein E1176_01930 [Fulvivirga sp. RKSG066]|uniref:hypothetical protein n=1 Tax=Fulvivirga aurantia TaxID=2529383 RepID=UPI0012BC637E|nr:hypothetical protein [Fulvivirga aurantia]MTI19772.1 hypothetical protein [Fulvivirga aurantia]